MGSAGSLEQREGSWARHPWRPWVIAFLKHTSYIHPPFLRRLKGFITRQTGQGNYSSLVLLFPMSLRQQPWTEDMAREWREQSDVPIIHHNCCIWFSCFCIMDEQRKQAQYYFGLWCTAAVTLANIKSWGQGWTSEQWDKEKTCTQKSDGIPSHLKTTDRLHPQMNYYLPCISQQTEWLGNNCAWQHMFLFYISFSAQSKVGHRRCRNFLAVEPNASLGRRKNNVQKKGDVFSTYCLSRRCQQNIRCAQSQWKSLLQSGLQSSSGLEPVPFLAARLGQIWHLLLAPSKMRRYFGSQANR